MKTLVFCCSVVLAFFSNRAEQKSHFVAKKRSVFEETNHPCSNAAPKTNLKSTWTAVEVIRLTRASVYAAMKVQCGG